MKNLQNTAASVKTRTSIETRETVAPAGVTLSEVLVSMLIMSVGVVSLATLFPISVIRTAQATQLTHSVFLLNNAEAAVESNLGLLSNAQIYGFSGLGVIDPLGVQLVGTPTVSSLGVGVGTSLGGVRRTDGLASTSITTAQRLALAEQLATLPDSWSLVREEAATSTPASLSASPPTITVTNPTTGLNVRNGQYPANALHRMVMFDATGKFAVLQPLYQSQILGQNLSWWNVNGSGTSLTTGPRLPTGFTPTRVRIEVQDRRYTWMMTVRKRWVPSGPVLGFDGTPGVSGTDDDGDGTTDWTNPPTNTIADTDEIRYSGSDDDPNWAAELDVAVFYNRAFLPAQTPASQPGDETAYALTFPVNSNVAGSLTGSWTGFDGQPGVNGVDDDNNLSVDTNSESGFPGSDDNRTVIVSYPAPLTKPYLKKGGYMLEPSQLKWYRILDLKDGAAANTTVLLLDQDLRYPPTTSTTVPGITGIFLKGIIEVYSLGSRTGQQ